jgi:hypothetical protein
MCDDVVTVQHPSPQHAAQHFDGMQRLAPCSVVDLVAATGAGGADHGAGARADSWQDCLLGDLHGEVVALLGKSKAAGQAAAARLQDFKFRTKFRRRIAALDSAPHNAF